MPPSEIRKDAREALRGKWGKAICIILVYLLVSYALSNIIGKLVIGLSLFISHFIDGFLKGGGIFFCVLFCLSYSIITTVPISFGLIISFMKLKRGEKVKVFGFLEDGFSNFKKSIGIWAHTLLKLLLPIVCLILIIILMAILMGINAINGSASVSIGLAILAVVLYIATLIYVVSRSFLYVIAYNISYDNPELSSKACVLKSEALMKGNRGNYFLLELSFIGWAILACITLGIGMLWLLPYMQVATVCFYERVAKPEVKKIEKEVKIEE